MKVIMCLPHLDYMAIRQDVIEACYRHFVTANDAKLATIRMVEMFSKYSLCHFVKDERPNKGWLSFHTETITALKLFIKKENKAPTCELLWLLAKVFCFEIDNDVRIDISLERNLLFINHGRKLMAEIGQEDTDYVEDEITKKQRRVYLCYLNYVIGKTLLYQATDIPCAHKHLMIARFLCVDLIKDLSSDLTEQRCPYRKRTDDIPEVKSDDVVRAFTSFCAFEMGTDFAKTFVCSKFQNDRDKRILQRASKIQSVCKSGYLSTEDFSNLSKSSFAMPLDLISKGFLSELVLHIMFYNGRALDELVSEAKEHDRQKVQEARDFEFQTCIKFADLMRSRDGFEKFPILHYLALDRGEQAYKLERKAKGLSIKGLENRISHIRNIMKQTPMYHFQLGILKTIPNASEYHNCECYRLLLKYHQQLFRLSKSKKILSEGQKDEKKFHEILLDMEKDNEPYKWVEMPRFYIQCAKFLHLSNSREDYELSIKLYQKAIDFEKERRVNLSRYLWEGNFGKAKCLVFLRRTDEAQNIYDELLERFKGTNQHLRIQKLEELFEKENI